MRTAWLLKSATYTIPPESTATPYGLLKRASVPTPSENPEAPGPPPARVVTAVGWLKHTRASASTKAQHWKITERRAGAMIRCGLRAHPPACAAPMRLAFRAAFLCRVTAYARRTFQERMAVGDRRGARLSRGGGKKKVSQHRCRTSATSRAPRAGAPAAPSPTELAQARRPCAAAHASAQRCPHTHTPAVGARRGVGVFTAVAAWQRAAGPRDSVVAASTTRARTIRCSESRRPTERA